MLWVYTVLAILVSNLMLLIYDIARLDWFWIPVDIVMILIAAVIIFFEIDRKKYRRVRNEEERRQKKYTG